MNTRDLAEQIRWLYGDVDWAGARGIVHVMAIVDQSEAVIALGPTAPRSAVDRFVLGLARARAELILTTGAILRSEPTLQHRYAEDEETNESFTDWRRRTLGFEHAPALLVFSRSGDIATDHPALRAAQAGIVWTSSAGRERLGPLAGRLSVEAGMVGGDRAASQVTSLPESIGSLLLEARSRFNAQTILIEAGPRLAGEFYRSSQAESPRLDELLLSRFEGQIASDAIGPRFEPIGEIREHFGKASTSVRVEESSGVWRFDRYRASRAEESVD